MTKTTRDDALYALSQVSDAAHLLVISLDKAKRLLEREDLPKPWERFDAAAEAADNASSDIDMCGDVGERIQIVIDTLEELADELPDD